MGRPKPARYCVTMVIGMNRMYTTPIKRIEKGSSTIIVADEVVYRYTGSVIVIQRHCRYIFERHNRRSFFYLFGIDTNYHM